MAIKKKGRKSPPATAARKKAVKTRPRVADRMKVLKPLATYSRIPMDHGRIEAVTVTWCGRDGVRYRVNLDLYASSGFWWNRAAMAPGGIRRPNPLPVVVSSLEDRGPCADAPPQSLMMSRMAAKPGNDVPPEYGGTQAYAMMASGLAFDICWFDAPSNQWICTDMLR